MWLKYISVVNSDDLHYEVEMDFSFFPVTYFLTHSFFYFVLGWLIDGITKAECAPNMHENLLFTR